MSREIEADLFPPLGEAPSTRLVELQRELTRKTLVTVPDHTVFPVAEVSKATLSSLNLLTELPIEVLVRIVRLLDLSSIKPFLDAFPEVKPHCIVYTTSTDDFYYVSVFKNLGVSEVVVEGQTRYIHDLKLNHSRRPLLRLFEITEMAHFGDAMDRDTRIELQTEWPVLECAAECADIVSLLWPASAPKPLGLQKSIGTLKRKGVAFYEINYSNPNYDNVIITGDRDFSDIGRYNNYPFTEPIQKTFSPENFWLQTWNMVKLYVNNYCSSFENLKFPRLNQLTISFTSPDSSTRPVIRNIVAPFCRLVRLSYSGAFPVIEYFNIGYSTLEREDREIIFSEFHQFSYFEISDIGIPGRHSEKFERVDLSSAGFFERIKLDGCPIEQLLPCMSFDETEHLIIKEKALSVLPLPLEGISLPEISTLTFETAVPDRKVPSLVCPKLSELYICSTAPGLNCDGILSSNHLDKVTRFSLECFSFPGDRTYGLRAKHLDMLSQRVSWLVLHGVKCPAIQRPSSILRFPSLISVSLDLIRSSSQEVSYRPRDTLLIRCFRYSQTLERAIFLQSSSNGKPLKWHLKIPVFQGSKIHTEGFDGSVRVNGHDLVSEHRRVKANSSSNPYLWLRVEDDDRFVLD